VLCGSGNWDALKAVANIKNNKIDLMTGDFLQFFSQNSSTHGTVNFSWTCGSGSAKGGPSRVRSGLRGREQGDEIAFDPGGQKKMRDER